MKHVILISGISFENQKFIEDIFVNSNLNFTNLNLSPIFLKVADEITEEYFSKEISLAKEITSRDFFNYLDLLIFIQKSNDKALCDLYKSFYAKVQVVNELILYKVYSKAFRECKKIRDSGKNCILFENILNDPYPARRDIFLEYFNFFGDKFKIINIYTSITNIVKQVINNNEKFINYFSSVDDIKKSYLKQIEDSKNGDFSIPRFENPLFYFENFFLVNNISKSTNLKKEEVIEVINSNEIDFIYKEAIIQIKKIFGFIAANNYPVFYPRIDILNDLGKSFLFLKELPQNTDYFITNNRSIHDLRINLEDDGWVDKLSLFISGLFQTKIDLSSVKWKSKKIFDSDSFHRKYSILDSKVTDKIKEILCSDNVFFHDYNENSIKNLSLQKYSEKTYHFVKNKLWDLFVYERNESKINKLYLDCKDYENFVFINDIYIQLYNIKKKHFAFSNFRLSQLSNFSKIKDSLNILNDDRPEN